MHCNVSIVNLSYTQLFLVEINYSILIILKKKFQYAQNFISFIVTFCVLCVHLCTDFKHQNRLHQSRTETERIGKLTSIQNGRFGFDD